MGKNVSEFCSMLYEMAKTDSSRRFHSLYDKVQRMDFLEEAWKQVSENDGSAGTDGMTIRSISEQGAQQLLELIQQELRERTYSPSPLRRVWIPKSNGKKRGLGIPTVKDRIVQTAVKMVIEPLFECDFEPFSYGFRPNKSAHDAVDEIVKYLNFGCEHVVDADITACFDNIPKHNLMMQIAKRISDGALLHLIRQFLDAGIMEDNEIHTQERGTPQGSPLSPLLANIFLDQLDKQWKHSLLWMKSSADAHLVRYADDRAPRRKWNMFNCIRTGIKCPDAGPAEDMAACSLPCSNEDGGGPPGAAMQVEAPNHRKLLWSKATVVSVTGKGPA